MKQYIAISLILCCSVIYTADQESKNLPVIEGASYYVIDGREKAIIVDRISGQLSLKELEIVKNASEEYATVFTAAGDPIKRISKAECKSLRDLRDMLDPSASAPRITTYGFKYWSATKGTKEVPGYFMVLRDKNGNHLKSYRYDKDTCELTLSYEPIKTVNVLSFIVAHNISESARDDDSDSDSVDIDDNRLAYKEEDVSCSIQ